MSTADERSEPDELGDHWRALVTSALLGTDRRDPPVPPPGPIADLVADATRPDAASRLLAQVAAVAAVRRAAFVPGPPVAPLLAPDPDPRPWATPAAVATWREVVVEWPVLEDEWLLAALDHGWRLPPDALVELLARHRNDRVRRAQVVLAAGPVAEWLVDQFPELAPATAGPGTASGLRSLPDLPVPPELAELLGADARTVARRLRAGFDGGEFGAAHRAVLVNLIARCRPVVLLDVAEALTVVGVGQALALADLARLRHRMLTELAP